MTPKLFSPLLFSFGILTVLSSHAEEKLFVQVPAVYDAQVLIGNKIKEECAVGNLVGNHVYGKINAMFPNSQSIQDPSMAGKDKVLTLTILSAVGAGGGAWSGGKAITVRADLMQNGKVIRSLVKQRGSRGGFWGGFKGTCGILEGDAQALAKDIVNWLAQPTSVASDSMTAPSSEPAEPSTRKEAQ